MAAEALETTQGAEGKPGSAGTRWRKPPGSLKAQTCNGASRRFCGGVMRVPSHRDGKPVVTKMCGGKRAVLESWAAENLLGEREYLSNPRIGASTLSTDLMS